MKYRMLPFSPSHLRPLPAAAEPPADDSPDDEDDDEEEIEVDDTPPQSDAPPPNPESYHTALFQWWHKDYTPVSGTDSTPPAPTSRTALLLDILAISLCFVLTGGVVVGIGFAVGWWKVNNSTPYNPISRHQTFEIIPDDPTLLQDREWLAGNYSEIVNTSGSRIFAPEAPNDQIPDLYGGYVRTPTPQLDPEGPASGIPASFSIWTAGLSVPQNWGASYTAAKTTALKGVGYPPLEVALVGDDNVWNVYLPAALQSRLQGLYGNGGTGYRGVSTPNMCYNGGGQKTPNTGGPGGMCYSAFNENLIACGGLEGDTFRLFYQVSPGAGSFQYIIDGQVVVETVDTQGGSVSVASVTATIPTAIGSTHQIAYSVTGTVCVYGIKAYYASNGGVILNTYSTTNGVDTDPRETVYYNTYTISTWRGYAYQLTPQLYSDLYVDGHMVITWFMTGDASNYTILPEYMNQVEGLNANLRSNSAYHPDVLFLRPILDGFLWNSYRPAMWENTALNSTMVMLDAATWWDFSSTLIKIHGGILPCGSTSLGLAGLPSTSNYCWNEGEEILLSDIGANIYVDMLMPLLDGTGYYANTGTWPRHNPNTSWPVPISPQCLNRPSVPKKPKKGFGVEPEGTHPILYDCTMLNSVNSSTYFNWDVIEPCSAQHALNVAAGTAQPGDFPMYMPMVYSELTIAFQMNLYEPGLPDISLYPVLKTFNEPNLVWEGYTTPTRAAMLWPLIENTGRVLVLPAPAQIGGDVGDPGAFWSPTEWIAEMLVQCVVVLGRPCVYDLADIHWYDGDPSVIAANVLQVNAVASAPVILSEFGYYLYSQSDVGVIQNIPVLYAYMWFALRTFADGDCYGTGWGLQGFYNPIDENDCLVYLGGSGDASLLDLQTDQLSITSVGLMYESVPSIPY